MFNQPARSQDPAAMLLCGTHKATPDKRKIKKVAAVHGFAAPRPQLGHRVDSAFTQISDIEKVSLMEPSTLSVPLDSTQPSLDVSVNEPSRNPHRFTNSLKRQLDDSPNPMASRTQPQQRSLPSSSFSSSPTPTYSPPEAHNQHVYSPLNMPHFMETAPLYTNRIPETDPPSTTQSPFTESSLKSLGTDNFTPRSILRRPDNKQRLRKDRHIIFVEHSMSTFCSDDSELLSEPLLCYDSPPFLPPHDFTPDSNQAHSMNVVEETVHPQQAPLLAEGQAGIVTAPPVGEEEELSIRDHDRRHQHQYEPSNLPPRNNCRPHPQDILCECSPDDNTDGGDVITQPHRSHNMQHLSQPDGKYPIGDDPLSERANSNLASSEDISRDISTPSESSEMKVVQKQHDATTSPQYRSPSPSDSSMSSSMDFTQGLQLSTSSQTHRLELPSHCKSPPQRNGQPEAKELCSSQNISVNQVKTLIAAEESDVHSEGSSEDIAFHGSLFWNQPISTCPLQPTQRPRHRSRATSSHADNDLFFSDSSTVSHESGDDAPSTATYRSSEHSVTKIKDNSTAWTSTMDLDCSLRKFSRVEISTKIELDKHKHAAHGCKSEGGAKMDYKGQISPLRSGSAKATLLGTREQHTPQGSNKTGSRHTSESDVFLARSDNFESAQAFIQPVSLDQQKSFGCEALGNTSPLMRSPLTIFTGELSSIMEKTATQSTSLGSSVQESIAHRHPLYKDSASSQLKLIHDGPQPIIIPPLQEFGSSSSSNLNPRQENPLYQRATTVNESVETGVSHALLNRLFRQKNSRRLESQQRSADGCACSESLPAAATSEVCDKVTPQLSQNRSRSRSIMNKKLVVITRRKRKDADASPDDPVEQISLIPMEQMSLTQRQRASGSLERLYDRTSSCPASHRTSIRCGDSSTVSGIGNSNITQEEECGNRMRFRRALRELSSRYSSRYSSTSRRSATRNGFDMQHELAQPEGRKEKSTSPLRNEATQDKAVQSLPPPALFIPDEDKYRARGGNDAEENKSFQIHYEKQGVVQQKHQLNSCENGVVMNAPFNSVKRDYDPNEGIKHGGVQRSLMGITPIHICLFPELMAQMRVPQTSPLITSVVDAPNNCSSSSNDNSTSSKKRGWKNGKSHLPALVECGDMPIFVAMPVIRFRDEGVKEVPTGIGQPKGKLLTESGNQVDTIEDFNTFCTTSPTIEAEVETGVSTTNDSVHQEQIIVSNTAATENTSIAYDEQAARQQLLDNPPMHLNDGDELLRKWQETLRERTEARRQLQKQQENHFLFSSSAVLDEHSKHKSNIDLSVHLTRYEDEGRNDEKQQRAEHKEGTLKKNGTGLCPDSTSTCSSMSGKLSATRAEKGLTEEKAPTTRPTLHLDGKPHKQKKKVHNTQKETGEKMKSEWQTGIAFNSQPDCSREYFQSSFDTLLQPQKATYHEARSQRYKLFAPESERRDTRHHHHSSYTKAMKEHRESKSSKQSLQQQREAKRSRSEDRAHGKKYSTKKDTTNLETSLEYQLRKIQERRTRKEKKRLQNESKNKKRPQQLERNLPLRTSAANGSELLSPVPQWPSYLSRPDLCPPAALASSREKQNAPSATGDFHTKSWTTTPNPITVGGMYKSYSNRSYFRQPAATDESRFEQHEIQEADTEDPVRKHRPKIIETVIDSMGRHPQTATFATGGCSDGLRGNLSSPCADLKPSMQARRRNDVGSDEASSALYDPLMRWNDYKLNAARSGYCQTTHEPTYHQWKSSPAVNEEKTRAVDRIEDEVPVRNFFHGKSERDISPLRSYFNPRRTASAASYRYADGVHDYDHTGCKASICTSVDHNLSIRPRKEWHTSESTAKLATWKRAAALQPPPPQTPVFKKISTKGEEDIPEYLVTDRRVARLFAQDLHSVVKGLQSYIDSSRM